MSIKKLKSSYVAYDADNNIVKSGVVTYHASSSNDDTVSNFCEAVVCDVGETLFEDRVIGIRSVK